MNLEINFSKDEMNKIQSYVNRETKVLDLGRELKTEEVEFIITFASENYQRNLYQSRLKRIKAQRDLAIKSINYANFWLLIFGAIIGVLILINLYYTK